MCVCIHYSAGQVVACPGCPHEELDDPMHPAYNCPVRPGGLEAMRARVTALETAGEDVAKVLEVMCRRLGEKNPRKTVPALVAWDTAKEGVSDA